jgi:hypothetical protein
LALVMATLLPLSACTAGNGGIGSRPPGADESAWGIRCAALRGQERRRLAENRAAALKQVRGLKPELVLVFDSGDESVVYYGRYRRGYDTAKNEPLFKPDARADLDLIRSLSITADGKDSWPFRYATMEELPAARSPHPEWDLASADAYWSLHVAVFYNDETISNRRYLAEEYCRELRGQGVEAYYHHGATNSSVCVGLFPAKAVQDVSETDPLTGVKRVVNRIVDERLLALQRQFTHSLQNGRRINDVVRDPKTGEIKERVPMASFLVKVPRAQTPEKRGPAGG